MNATLEIDESPDASIVFRQVTWNFLKKYPHPPRKLPRDVRRAILRYALLYRDCLVYAFIAVPSIPLGIMACFESSTISGEERNVILLAAGLLAVGLGALTAGFLRIWNIHRALRLGMIGEATVLGVNIRQSSTWGDNSIEITAGEREVTFAGGAFVEKFKTKDEYWVRSLRVGDEISVLVNPKGSKTILELGPRL